jgi:phosphoribosylglycinamide formyltransferase-1
MPKGLVFAREHGIATAVLDHKPFDSREAFDAALAQQIDSHEPALVVLAGFMRILTPGFVRTMPGGCSTSTLRCCRHFRAAHAPACHRCGLQVCRCTVHQVTAELDVGPILDQAVVPVLPGTRPRPWPRGC